MSDPVTPVAPVVPAADPNAAAPVVPAAPEVKSAAVVTPVPATPAAPAKTVGDLAKEKADGSLLDQAKSAAKAAEPVSPVNIAHDKAVEALEAWQKNPTPETKAAADKAVADAKAAVELAKAPATSVVPEKYEFKAPQGVTLDKAALEAFEPVAKELGLSNEQANKLVALQASIIAKQQENDLKLWEDHQAKQKDEAIKGLGAKWQEELAYAATARDRFFSKDAVQALNNAGVANNLHILKAFIAMGRQISPEKLVDGMLRNETKSAAQVMYPSMVKQ